MNNYKSEFYWWWGWHCEPFENYLEEMALGGWLLEKSSLGHVKLDFKKSEPSKVRFCVDYQNKAHMPQEYYNIMEDDGWELINVHYGWYLWKKAYKEERPTLFSDKQSLIDRNNRVIWMCAILILAQAFMVILAGVNMIFFSVLLYALIALNYSILGYALYKLLKQNNQLRF